MHVLKLDTRKLLPVAKIRHRNLNFNIYWISQQQVDKGYFPTTLHT